MLGTNQGGIALGTNRTVQPIRDLVSICNCIEMPLIDNLAHDLTLFGPPPTSGVLTQRYRLRQTPGGTYAIAVHNGVR